MAAEQKNIVIIGGGIIGCTAAYYLTRHPKYDPSRHTITLLEATGIASGASGKAGGLLALWAYPVSLVPLSFRLHEELATEHDGAARWGYRRLHCGELRLKGRTSSTKGSHASTGDDDDNDAKKSPGTRKSTRRTARPPPPRKTNLPSSLDWFAPESLYSDSYTSIGTPSTTAQVHPHQFTTSMAALAAARGARIVLGTATAILHHDDDDGGDGVRGVRYQPAPAGDASSPPAPPATLDATDVLLAAGPWTSHVWPAAPIGAQRAHSVVLRPARPVSAFALFTDISMPEPELEPEPGPERSPEETADGDPSASNSSSSSSSHSHSHSQSQNTNASTNTSTSKKSPPPPRPRPGKRPPTRRRQVQPEMYARPDGTVYVCGAADDAVALPASSAAVQCDPARCAALLAAARAVSDALRCGERDRPETEGEGEGGRHAAGHAEEQVAGEGAATLCAEQACYLPLVQGGGGGGGGPLVGRTGVAGLWLAAGHSCWGIQNAPATGKVLSEWIFDGTVVSAQVAGLDPRQAM